MSSGRAKSPKLIRHNLLDSIDLSKPLYKGYMYKQSHVPPKNFNKRFFVLYPKVLVYYDTESHFARDVSSKSLAHRHKAIFIDHLYLSKPDKKPSGAKFCFILHAPNAHNERHDILLVTETREDRRVWMDKLQQQNPDLLDSEHRHSSSSSSSGNLLAVPKPRKVRADSVTPPDVEMAEEVQKLQIEDRHSDEES